MRLSADLIQKSSQYMNPVDEFHIDLRNYRIQVLENLTATNDQFGCIDLSNNEIQTLNHLPQLDRLTTLMLNNNKISQIQPNFQKDCHALQNLLLTNNKITSIHEIENLSKSGHSLVRLSLMGNLVTNMPYYRPFVISRFPSLRTLDF